MITREDLLVILDAPPSETHRLLEELVRRENPTFTGVIIFEEPIKERELQERALMDLVLNKPHRLDLEIKPDFGLIEGNTRRLALEEYNKSKGESTKPFYAGIINKRKRKK